MIDRKQVMYDIERCICHVPDACRDCSHYKHGEYLDCMEELLKDALALLKEQESERLEWIGAVAKLTAENELLKKKVKEQEAEIEKLQDRLQHAVEAGEVLLEEMKRHKETFWDSLSEADLMEPMHHFED